MTIGETTWPLAMRVGLVVIAPVGILTRASYSALVRHINKHSNQKYTAAPANSGVRRERNQWMVRQARTRPRPSWRSC